VQKLHKNIIKLDDGFLEFYDVEDVDKYLKRLRTTLIKRLRYKGGDATSADDMVGIINEIFGKS
jgi:hypothetical protein